MKIIVRLIFILFYFSSCYGPKKLQNSISECIPSTFNPNKTTLLIEKFYTSEKVQKILDNFMSKNYPYRYEFVEKKDLIASNSKYADVKLYKFVLVGISKGQGALVVIGKPEITAYRFIDREKNIEYQRTVLFEPKTYIPMFQAIIRKISEEN